MSSIKGNYDIHDKERLTIIVVFQKWRVYFEGLKYPVKVLINYKNLTYFTTIKKLNRR
jgi:hypothetical protein